MSGVTEGTGVERASQTRSHESTDDSSTLHGRARLNQIKSFNDKDNMTKLLGESLSSSVCSSKDCQLGRRVFVTEAQLTM